MSLRRNQKQISELLDLLHVTSQRLEELTFSQVDTATDPEGRLLLLRGTYEQLKHNELGRQTAILNALPANIALLDPDGTIVSVNDGWRLFAVTHSMGGGPGQGLGMNYLAICDGAVGKGAGAAHLAASGIRSVLSGGSKSFTLEYQSDSSTDQRWFQLSVTPLSPIGWSREAAVMQGVVVMHCDISCSKRDQSNLESLAQRLSLATEIAKVGVWERDTNSNTLKWDATMFSIYGLPQTEVMSYEQWARTVHPEDLSEVEATTQRAIDRQGIETTEFRIITEDSNVRYVSAAEKAVYDSSGHVCRVIGVNVDVTQRKKADEELHRNQAMMTHLAEHDFLTGLPNQMVLRDRIDQAIKIATRNHKKVAILFLDLDGFQYINDSLGHLIGDKLLQATASRLEGTMRASDTLCRFGGDEFVALLPDLPYPEGTAVAAARLLDALTGIQMVEGNELQVSACIGISAFPEDGLDGDTLIKNADAAMYYAKEKGNSSVQFFHPDMNLRAMERQFIEQNLRRALARNELTLNYQPKFDLQSRSVTGVEALLRWHHPVRGQISPAQFIPVAEDCGLISAIGIWVLEEACKQTRAWSNAGLATIRMSVNVSGKQFQNERFHESVMQILNRTEMKPETLELEVTESLLMKSPELTTSLLQNLRREGVTVAIDDFGTGYSSLSYLQKFPIDALKIDQSFIRQIESRDGLNIVRAIILMGHTLGMRIVAEGVETEYEANLLQSIGCDDAQGYYFSRPMIPERLAALLDRRS